jgi:hypothetical protein
MSKSLPPFGTDWTRRSFMKSSTSAVAAALLATPLSRQADAQSAETFDFYISTTGSDDNPGTLASPWAITAINTKRSTYRGKKVGLLAGIYDLSGMRPFDGSGGNSPPPILHVAAGTASSPTVIKSVVPRAAILELKSSSGVRSNKPAIGQFGRGTGAAEKSYVTIDGLTVRGGAFWLMSFFGGTPSDYSQYSLGIVIQNCHLHDSILPMQDNNPAIWIDCCIDPIVRNNLFHDISDVSAGGVGPCAVMTLSVRGLVMEYNEGYNLRTFLLDKHNDGNGGYASDGFIIRYNYVHDIADTFIMGLDTEYHSNSPTGPYNACYVHNNVLVGCGAAWYTKINAPTRMDVNIYNNTFVLTRNLPGDNGGWWGPSAAATHQISYYNNIIRRNGFSMGYMGDLAVSTQAVGIINYNSYDPAAFRANILSPLNSNSSATTVTAYSSLSSWRSATGADANSTQAAPIFVGGSKAAAYALAANSPGLNAGRVGGVSSGAAVHLGAWDGRVTRIGCDFGAIPSPPVMLPVT